MMMEAARGVISNGALLLLLGALYVFLPVRPDARTWVRKAALGLVLGIIGIGVMLTRWELQPGVLFDARSVVLAISGLFFGWLPTVVAAVAMGAFRVSQGGPGVVAGLLIILSSAVIGLLWRHVFPSRRSWLDYYLVGLLVHVAMLLSLFVMPRDLVLDALRNIGLPVMVGFPLLTMVLAKLMELQRESRDAREGRLRNERRLQGLLDKSWEILHLIDGEGRTLYVSESIRTILGHEPGEVVGGTWDSLVHPEDRPEALEVFRKLAAMHGETVTLLLRLRHADGHWVWFENTGTNLLADPDVGAVVVNSRDVTERRQREREIEAWQDLMEYVIRHDPTGIAVLDRDLRFVFVSDRFLTDYRRREEDLVGRHHYEVFPDLPEKWRRAHRRALAGEVVEAEDDVFVREDGTQELTRWQVHPWYGGDGDVMGVILYTEMTTERKALEESYRAVLQISLEGFFVGDLEGRILDVNDTLCRKWGYEKDELLGMRVHEIDAEQSGEEIRRRLEEAAGGKGQRFSTRHRCKDGSIMDVEVSLTHLDVEGGRVFVFVRDLSAYAQAQRDLEEERQRLQNIIEGTDVGTWEWNVQTGETVFNDRWAEMLGYRLEELEPTTVRTWERLAHPGDLETARVLLERHMAGELETYECEHRMRHKDGHWVWVQDRGKLVDRTEEGEPLRMFGTHLDTTERNRILHSLRESEELYRHLFDRHSAVKLLIDPDTGSLLDANLAAERFYGWSGDQLKEMTIHDLNVLPPEEVRAELRAARSGERVQFEFRHRRADGSIRDVEVFSSSVDIQGKTVLHSIIHDITGQRQLEEQLAQSRKLEAVGRLAGGVAHDFNNMLAVIMGATEMALPEVPPESSLYEDLKQIDEAAQRSADLTRQLLAFSRKQIIKPAQVNLNTLVVEHQKTLGRLIGEDIRIELGLEGDLWDVFIDPSQVDQILANLSVNARDAIHGVGTLTIDTGNVVLDSEYSREDMPVEKGEYAMLSVTDSGEGMDRETLDHIFEPFFTTKGEAAGTGLGLATVYGIVKQNQGVIHVYSEKGLGTTFKIYLPRYQGDAEEPEKKTRKAVPGGSETILLVEDEDTILSLAERYLRRKGYKVLVARDPEEALEAARTHEGEIDLLLSDVVMPGMNGKQLETQLRERQPDFRTLFMSGYTANVIARRGVLEEGVQFIQKPFTMSTLAHRVREVLDLREADLR
jgi:PAS domain S-box-containing protein